MCLSRDASHFSTDAVVRVIFYFIFCISCLFCHIPLGTLIGVGTKWKRKRKEQKPIWLEKVGQEKIEEIV